MLALTILFLFASRTSSDPIEPIAYTPRSLQPRQGGSTACSTSGAWENSLTAWQDASVDTFLQTFLKGLSKTQAFDRALASQYGAHYTAFKCGVDLYSTCPLPTCTDYQDTREARAAYFATVSTVHLSTIFSILHHSITTGQADYYGLTDDLADNFFSWKDPEFVGNDISFWIVAGITCIFSALTFGLVPPVTSLAVVSTVAGFGSFLGAAVQQTTLSLTPEAGVTRNVGISALKKASAQLSELSRISIETWANNTFAGLPDTKGNTIVDYFRGGGFLLDTSLPSLGQAERYYKTSMVAKTINGQWRTKANYLMFASTANRNGAFGPTNSRYYSDLKKGVYNLYNFDSGVTRAPDGLQLLNETSYGISPQNITKSSARAWEFAGGNNKYTSDMALSRIQDSFRSNGTLNPFADGPAWEGTFTLPVCDVGNHTEWLTDYGGPGLPCCCGVDCADTKSFVAAANLNTSGALLDGCRSLLKDTLINFDHVDYGITRSAMSFRDMWNYEWSTGRKAGIVIGFIAAFFAFVLICVCLGIWRCG